MKQLAKKIAELTKENYDRKIYSTEEVSKKINPDIARGLRLCDEFGVNAIILASEIIHSKDELHELKSKSLSFREQGNNDEAIAELTELVTELQTELRAKIDQASKMKSWKAKEDAHAEALEVLQPLAAEVMAIREKVQASNADMRLIDGSHFGNPINPEAYRIMNKLGQPGIFN